MTLKELSERLGMTQNGLQHILNTNTTKIDTLEKIAETLNVSIGTFFLDTNSDFTNNKELKLLHDRIKELEYQLMEKRELISFYKEKLNEMKLTKKTLCSMNFFGLLPSTVEMLEGNLKEFKVSHPNDRKSECYLPVELSNLIKAKKIKIKLVPTKSEWIGITNPEDEAIVREALSKKD